MNQRTELIHQRNILLVKISWIILPLIIISNLITKTVSTQFFVVLGMMAILFSIFSIIIYKKLWTIGIMYCMTITFNVEMFFIILSKENTTNFLWLFCTLAFSSMYQSGKAILLSTSLFVSVITYFFYFGSRDHIFANTVSSDFGYIVFAIISTSMILMFQNRFNENLRKKSFESEQKALNKTKELEEVLNQSQKSADAVTHFASGVYHQMEKTNQNAIQTKENVGEIKEKLLNQNERMIQINELMERGAVEIEELDSFSTHINEGLKQTKEKSDEGKNTVEDLAKNLQQISFIIQEAVSNMKELKEDNQKISSILETIESISSQTNLLALNASIEAARAGEHGRGFSVVAEEIRKLADHSSTSTKEIFEIVHDIQEKTDKTSSQIYEGDEMIRKGTTKMEKVESLFQEIAENTTDIFAEATELKGKNIKELKSSNGKITQEMEVISSMANENVSSIETVSHHSTDLSKEIHELLENVKELEKETKGLKK
jgi:methyl-accepting chemotaxis protein